MIHAVGSLVLGWLLADLITATFHWWEDRFGSEDWPIIGPWVIGPNRLHHIEPLTFTRTGFLSRNGASITAAIIIGSLWSWLFGPSVLMAATVAGGALSNEVHRYAHQPSAANSVIRVLQKTGAIQSPKGHAAHHRPPQDSNYCVLTDWLNPILEALNLWPRLERLFGRTEQPKP